MTSVRGVALTIHHDRSIGSGAPGATEAIALALENSGVSASVHGFELVPSFVPASLKPLVFPLAVRSMALRELGRGTNVIDASTGDLAALRRSELAAFPGIVLTRSHGLEHLVVAERRAAAARGELSLRRRYGLYHGGLRLGLVGRSLRIADGVFALNSEEASFMVEVLGVDPSRIALTRNGIDEALIGRGFVAPSTKRRSVALMGPTSWRKGGDLALRLVGELLDDDATVEITWVGIDAAGATALKPLTQRHQGRLHVSERYDRSELPQLLSGSQLLVVTARSEGMPLSLLEAAACSLPAVAVAIAGVRDVVVGSGGGRLVAHHDTRELQREVATLLDTPEELDELAARAYGHAQQSSWTSIVAAQLDFASELIARKARNG